MTKTSVGDTASLVEGVRQGEARAIARAISTIENRERLGEKLVQELFFSTGRALLVGVTGAPGTGKSSLVNRLAAEERAHGQTVGVIAVDPTSPFTGGALLGDRIRMQQHATDDGIYIRSMATRGFLGGLARATGDAALVLDAAGKQRVFIETVGVGQDEVDIVRLADVTVVLLVPGMGDDVQSFKAGVMEIADLFVINKADQSGAERLEQEVSVVLGLSQRADGWKPPIIKTVATEGTGVSELVAAIESYLRHLEKAGLREQKRVDRWKERLLDLIRQKSLERVLSGGVGAAQLETFARQIARREREPYGIVEELLGGAGVAR